MKYTEFDIQYLKVEYTNKMIKATSQSEITPFGDELKNLKKANIFQFEELIKSVAKELNLHLDPSNLYSLSSIKILEETPQIEQKVESFSFGVDIKTYHGSLSNITRIDDNYKRELTKIMIHTLSGDMKYTEFNIQCLKVEYTNKMIKVASQSEITPFGDELKNLKKANIFQFEELIKSVAKELNLHLDPSNLYSFSSIKILEETPKIEKKVEKLKYSRKQLKYEETIDSVPSLVDISKKLLALEKKKQNFHLKLNELSLYECYLAFKYGYFNFSLEVLAYEIEKKIEIDTEINDYITIIKEETRKEEVHVKIWQKTLENLSKN